MAAQHDTRSISTKTSTTITAPQVRLFERQIEGNLLNPYADVYPAAVERVAIALRPRFESGELRGWTGEDFEGKPRALDPLSRIENECRRRYIKNPLRALAIILHSPSTEAGDWRWERVDAGVSLLAAAESAMAKDVLQLARERGWTKPRRGERPAFERRARRAS